MNKIRCNAVRRSRANSEYHSKYRKPLVTQLPQQTEHNKHNTGDTNSQPSVTIDIKDENNLNKAVPSSVKGMFGTFGTYNSKGDYMPYFSSRMTNEELAAYFAEYTTQQLEAEARGNSSEDGDSDRVEAVSTARLGLLRAELQRRDWLNQNK